ncbi:MAG: transposase, partial [Chloroflexi bacterium]|nr:transposase [Chloroflexota bacterium]
MRQTPAHSRSRFAPIPPCLRRLQLAQRAGYPLHLKHKNSDAFIAFLDHLLRQHPRLKLILVLDNASYHRSKPFRRRSVIGATVSLLIWLPKYSPFLNPIERF